jgi:hypothetical protein
MALLDSRGPLDRMVPQVKLEPEVLRVRRVKMALQELQVKMAQQV